MQRWIQFGLLVYAVVVHCEAQVDLLSLTESEDILEKLPEFKASEARGDCPGFQLLAPGTHWRFELQVRGFCPPDGSAGSTTVGNFAVDRSTGAVSGWAAGQPVSEPPEMESLAAALAARARSRVLSQREAQCLARQAVRGAAGPGEPLSVNPGTGVADREAEFIAKYRTVQPALPTAWNIWVDTSSILVLENANGPSIHSLEIDELVSRMRAVRRSPSLSTLEAIDVAVQVPGILARIPDKCPLLSADFGTASGRFIAVEDTCQSYPRAFRVLAAVDLLTGAVTDPRTRKTLDTPQSIALARRLLQQASERQAAAKTEIERLCR
jgi:hypothetical protein